ncbi:MAG: CNP1-like family protein [Granulosicoccaceae bacterium]|jgi:hypothetical protein
MKTIRPTIATLISLLGLAHPTFLFADEPLPTDDPDLGGFIEGPKWQEQEVDKFPAWPDEDKLLPVEVDAVDAPFRFFVDPDSLSVGSDGVSRYTVVIRSSSGASNVMYEGLRCRTREYRTYAYGTTDNKFHKATVSNWQPVQESSSGSMIHRYNFLRYYMCDRLQNPRTVADVLREIRYPKHFHESGGYL